MKLSTQMAWKYLVGKKSTNAIQIITGISVFGLAFGTAAIILILSVFNGFESLLLSMYNTFNPQLKIELKEGKSFLITDSTFNEIKNIDGVQTVSKTLEEMAMIVYNDKQHVATIKGVDDAFEMVTDIDSANVRGDYLIQADGISYGYFGIGLSYRLGINIYDKFTEAQLYIPNLSSGPFSQKTTSASIYPSGTFSIGQEEDNQCVLVPLSIVQRLIKKPGFISAIEIDLTDDADEFYVKSTLNKILGTGYNVMNKDEQEQGTIRVMRIEKWLAFIILVLALILIALNLIGAIWMIILDKKQNIIVLKSMGATNQFIQSLFLKLGLLISSGGFLLGLLIAVVFYKLHKQFNLISMGENAIIDAYPIELFYSDIPIVAVIVMAIGIAASVLPAWRAGKIEGRLVGR